MCECTPQSRQPVCRWCPRELQIKWGLIKEKKQMNQEMTEPKEPSNTNAPSKELLNDNSYLKGYNAGYHNALVNLYCSLTAPIIQDLTVDEILTVINNRILRK